MPIVRLAEPEPLVMTLLGEKLAEAPEGRPLTDKVTFPVKPLRGDIVTEYTASVPAVTDCEFGLMEPTKSPREVFTSSGTVVLFVSLPLEPVMVSVYAPRGVVEAVVTSNEEVPDPPIMLAGVSLAVAPAGRPLTLRATVPVKPFSETTFAV